MNWVHKKAGSVNIFTTVGGMTRLRVSSLVSGWFYIYRDHSLRSGKYANRKRYNLSTRGCGWKVASSKKIGTLKRIAEILTTDFRVIPWGSSADEINKASREFGLLSELRKVCAQPERLKKIRNRSRDDHRWANTGAINWRALSVAGRIQAAMAEAAERFPNVAITPDGDVFVLDATDDDAYPTLRKALDAMEEDDATK